MYFKSRKFSNVAVLAAASGGGGGGITVPSGLLYYLPLDTGTTSGSTTNDLSGNGYNSTLTGSPSIVTGQIAQGISLNGSSQYVTSPASAVPVPAAVTVTAWINFAGLTNAYTALLTAVDSVSQNSYQLLVKSNGKLAVYVGIASTFVDYDGTGSHTLTTGTWYHVAFSYDSVNGVIGYVNAVSDGTGAAGSVMNSSLFATISVGNDSENPGRIVDGIVDDVRVYNRTLSPTEISEIYTAGLAGNP